MPRARPPQAAEPRPARRAGSRGAAVQHLLPSGSRAPTVPRPRGRTRGAGPGVSGAAAGPAGGGGAHLDGRYLSSSGRRGMRGTLRLRTAPRGPRMRGGPFAGSGLQTRWRPGGAAGVSAILGVVPLAPPPARGEPRPPRSCLPGPEAEPLLPPPRPRLHSGAGLSAAVAWKLRAGGAAPVGPALLGHRSPNHRAPRQQPASGSAGSGRAGRRGELRAKGPRPRQSSEPLQSPERPVLAPICLWVVFFLPPEVRLNSW